MVPVFFSHREQELSCIIYKILFRFLSSESLALVIQTSSTKDFGRSSKVGKKYRGRYNKW